MSLPYERIGRAIALYTLILEDFRATGGLILLFLLNIFFFSIFVGNLTTKTFKILVSCQHNMNDKRIWVRSYSIFLPPKWMERIKI